MTPEERRQELGNALGSIYRVRMDTGYDELGARGVAEIVLAEVLVHRARERAAGRTVKAALPPTVRELRAELARSEGG